MKPNTKNQPEARNLAITSRGKKALALGGIVLAGLTYEVGPKAVDAVFKATIDRSPTIQLQNKYEGQKAKDNPNVIVPLVESTDPATQTSEVQNTTPQPISEESTATVVPELTQVRQAPMQMENGGSVYTYTPETGGTRGP